MCIWIAGYLNQKEKHGNWEGRLSAEHAAVMWISSSVERRSFRADVDSNQVGATVILNSKLITVTVEPIVR